MKIGLVGEAPNDTLSIKKLLLKKYTSEDFNFVNMLDHITGSQLDSQKTKRLLRIEFESQKPDFIIFIRDLDALLQDKDQYYKRKEYFRAFNSVVNKKGIFLLHIFEIEALILADISVFNEIYNTEIPSFPNVMEIVDPKEFLKSAAKRYNESHNADIFDALNFEKLLMCGYFDGFIKRFEKKINT